MYIFYDFQIVVSSNHVHGEVYWIQHYVIKSSVTCDRFYLWFSMGTPVSSTKKTYHHDITEILLKMALNTIKPNQIISLYFPFVCGKLMLNIFFNVFMPYTVIILYMHSSETSISVIYLVSTMIGCC
jgi:hypothetical protein